MFHGIDCGLLEQRMTPEHTNVDDVPLLIHVDFEYDGRLHTCAFCEFGIDR